MRDDLPVRAGHEGGPRSLVLDLYRPSDLAELRAVAASHPDGALLLFAGGVEAVPALRRGMRPPRVLVDLKRVAELHGVVAEPEALTMHSGATIDEVVAATAGGPWAWLGDVLDRTANHRVRARGTVGGNLEGDSPISDLRLAAALAGARWATVDLRTGARHESELESVRDAAAAPERVATELRIPRPAEHTGYGHCRYPARGALVEAAGVTLGRSAGRWLISGAWVSRTSDPVRVRVESDAPTPGLPLAPAEAPAVADAMLRAALDLAHERWETGR